MSIGTQFKSFPNGMTVKELKDLIKDWPETNEIGEPTEVWMELPNGHSAQVMSVWPLNAVDIELSFEEE